MWLLLALLACGFEKVESGDSGGHESAGEPNDSEDCDDNDAAIDPDATEECDGLDNDCDGEIDEGVTGTYYWDVDGDGYGDDAHVIESCESAGWTAVGGDCDDYDPSAYPDAEELCDGADNDCDDVIDEDLPQTIWYADADADGSGNAASTFSACDAPDGYVENASDCDDADRALAPGAIEHCDEFDNDCDSDIDEDGPSTWYVDADGDGFGDASLPVTTCSPGDGYSIDATDCDDASSSVHPGAYEFRADDVDNDCDGEVDEGTVPGPRAREGDRCPRLGRFNAPSIPVSARTPR